RKDEGLKLQPANLFTVKVINEAAVFGATEGQGWVRLNGIADCSNWFIAPSALQVLARCAPGIQIARVAINCSRSVQSLFKISRETPVAADSILIMLEM